MSHDTAGALARLVEETERVARQVEDVRCRIAAVAKRRPTPSEETPIEARAAANDPHPCATSAPEGERGPTPPSERIPCLEAVSKLLPPLKPFRGPTEESGVYALEAETGRYTLVSSRRDRQPHADLPAASKSKASA